MTKKPPRRRSPLLVLCVAVALFAMALPVLISGDVSIVINDELPRLAKDRTVLVTCANAGLGLATVKLIAQAGTAKKVVLACRNTAKCKQAQQEVQQELPEFSKTQILTVHLDFANRDSIVEGARSIQQQLSDSDVNNTTTSALDILINNAGVAFTRCRNAHGHQSLGSRFIDTLLVEQYLGKCLGTSHRSRFFTNSDCLVAGRFLGLV
jgi:NAD(P)-dependent dehydrogenase (short-subunit alcohol dehydrogenase family)